VSGPAVINFIVQNLGAVRQFYDEIRVHRSVTGRAGPYVEVTAAGVAEYPRIPLEDDKVVYEFAHRQGDPTDWYRVSYSLSTDATGTVESSQCDPVRADLEQVRDVITAQEIKTNFLFGLDLTDDRGEELPDSVYEWYALAATDLLESQLDIAIRTRTIDSSAVDGGVSAPGDEFQDFLVQEYYKFIWLQLDRYPVISVDRIRLVLPNGQEIINFDTSWFKVLQAKGQVMIIPSSGSTATITLGQSGAWLPLVYGWTDFIPDVFEIRYTAGFANGVPPALKNLVGKMAAIGPLAILGDLIIGAGIAEQNISMDGLMQNVRSTASATNSGFGARIRQYLAEIKQERKDLYRFYRGIPLQVA